MNEIDEYTQEIILNFLQINFPIKKLKDGRRFKRGIIIDSGFIEGPTRKVFFKPQAELNSLFILLSKVLEDVFSIPKLEINMALMKYLNLI